MKPFLGDDFNLCSHSLKSGAATVAVANGLDGDAIAVLINSSKFRYISDSVSNNLSVSRNLGL